MFNWLLKFVDWVFYYRLDIPDSTTERSISQPKANLPPVLGSDARPN
jgi:hypothetical protein